ncbi:RidA family protein [Gaopeijia maritima]|uniref:RidA family protein n=1 Tax=Gaopeijia maritima TaxID=3119007 RepID=A0ABU9E5Z3_9BACT
MTWEIINPEALGAPRGWNNGMLAPAGGRVLFVAGQVASDATGRIVTDDFAEQFGVALANCVTVVRAAGGSAADIGRLTIYVTDMEAYRNGLKDLGPHYRDAMGRHYPAMALVEVAGLVDPAARVEIEATAVLAPSDD